MREIKVLEMGVVSTGWFICPADADYPYGTIVPESDYLAEEQDWHRVARIKGHADIADYVLEYHDGTPYVSSGVQSSAEVWVLCENGEPVVQDEPNG
jgi:hypothetical protein